jgi:1,6-anhydro-N-acetylmuramate kinase
LSDPLPTSDLRNPTYTKQRILKLRGDQERRRFFVGASVDSPVGCVTVALVAATGRGMEARFEVANHVAQPMPGDVAAELKQLVRSGPSAAASSWLVTRLTETAGIAAERLGAVEHEVWPAACLCGALAPSEGLDAALLAELTQLNVVDGFAARDAALNGTGQHLDALPLWLLLHHPQLHRLVVQTAPEFRLLHLPASRDERGAGHIVVQQADSAANLRQRLSDHLKRTNPAPAELLWMATESGDCGLPDELLELSPTLAMQTPETLGIAAEALSPASAAVLAMLHIDQTPANLPYLTGASAPRVLGRLTPGSAKSWNRLLRDLAFSRPLVTPLRAAV